MALSMTLGGAREETRKAMATTLKVGDVSFAEVSGDHRFLPGHLNSLDSRVDLAIANSIWYRSGLPVRAAFLDSTRRRPVTNPSISLPGTPSTFR